MGIVDSNADPDLIDYVIPGNDDSIKSIKLISSVISNSISEGKQLFAKKNKRPNSPAKPRVKESTKSPEEK